MSSTRSSLNQTLSSADLPGGLRHSTSVGSVGGLGGERETGRMRYSGYDRDEREREHPKVRNMDWFSERERVSLRERESNLRGEDRDREMRDAERERGRESNVREERGSGGVGGGEPQMRSPASSRRRNSVTNESRPMDTGP